MDLSPSTQDTSPSTQDLSPSDSAAASGSAAASSATATASGSAAAAASESPSSWLGRNVYVRNLPPVNMMTMEMPSEVHITNLFSKFGKVEKLRVVRDSISGRPIGTALVLFEQPSCAQAAVNYINQGGCMWATATLWVPKTVLHARH
jgi:RNA recognition motif-containing protein